MEPATNVPYDALLDIIRAKIVLSGGTLYAFHAL
jgi:hypothetical protein